MACFEEGLPMVAIPLAGGDQAGNARRCADLGVARVVAPDERTPEAIREAVLDVLRNPRYRENAEHLRREIRALPEPEHAVELLERLALERAPSADTPRRAQRRYERA
jgi:UDP:flavonoid glycosyltransferase YjiC (YdhE family)